MKGVSCTQGGHNGEQLANMCLPISEDVPNSLMSKNNSNNDAAADCINNNKVDRVAFLDPAEYKRRAQAAGIGGGWRGASACFLLGGSCSPSKNQKFKERAWMRESGNPGCRPGFTMDSGNSLPF